jgi:hypothetical protein
MKTAIVLYGYLRTWNWCKDSIIDTMNLLCGDDKDWFIGLWNTTTSTQDDVNNYLKSKNQNIISSRWIDSSNNLLIKHYDTDKKNYIRVSGSSSGPAYLRQLISLDKRKYEYENNIKYDRVLFIRPDVVYYTNGMSAKRYNDRLSYMEEDLTLQLDGDFDDYYAVGGPSAHDLVPIAGRLSSDIYSHMYLDLTPPHDLLDKIHLRGGGCPHALLSEFTNTHMIRSRNIKGDFHYFFPRIIRPNSDINRILSELCTWDGKTLSYDGVGFEDYTTWLRNERHDTFIFQAIDMCKSLNIDLEDYNLHVWRICDNKLEKIQL